MELSLSSVAGGAGVVMCLVVRGGEPGRWRGGGQRGGWGAAQFELNSEVHVTKLELERVLVPLLVTLSIMAVVLAKMGERREAGTAAECASPRGLLSAHRQP